MGERIGFIGLGVLGSAMVPHLLARGYSVLGYDINPQAMGALQTAGMEGAGSPREAADGADHVITCLPSLESLRQVYSGSDGLDKSSRRDQIVLEVSTFPVAEKEWARDAIAQAGKRLLDCPVTGNRILAKERKLTAFCSGNADDHETVRPVIDAFAHRQFFVGEFGDGMKMKFCANILNLVHNAAAAEVMVLGMKSGLDPKRIHEVIGGSGSSSSMFEVRGAMMAENDYDHEGMNFSIPIKDSRFISDHAHRLQVPTPIYHVALQSYYAAVAQGLGDLDAAAVCRAMERAANVDRETDPG